LRRALRPVAYIIRHRAAGCTVTRTGGALIVETGEIRITAAHYLEAMCLVWILAVQTSGNWKQAFKLLRA